MQILTRSAWLPRPLHSNLVIFKLYPHYCPLSCYSSLHSNLVIFKCNCRTCRSCYCNFTFQSGYIQIDVPFSSVSPFDWLYIPIWLYSNSVASLTHYMHLSLYIPIWLYSNTDFALIQTKFRIFTFQSGYIQMSITSNPLTSSKIFTFQSGYIQILVPQ